MVKLYTEKPIPKTDTDPNAKNNEDTSLFQQHNSGKVQHSVIAEKTLSQVNALQDKIERIHMAEDSVNLNTQVSGNYITTHKGDEVKTDLTQLAQTHEQTTQANDLIQHEVEQHTQTIEANNLSRHYTAPNVNFDYNQINHITGGSESISSSQNINMVSQNFNLSADSHQVSAVTVNGGGKMAEVEAGHMHIDANKAVFQIGSSMNVSAGDYNGSLTTHMNRSNSASRTAEEEANPDFVYIKDIVYSAQTGQLYFLNSDESQDLYSAEKSHLSNADMLVGANADDKTENCYQGVFLQSQCDGISSAMKSGQAISKVPQLNWVTHLGTMRMCMVPKTALDKLSLSLPFSQTNIQNKKVNWSDLANQLQSKLQLPYKKVIIDNETALNDSIDDLSTQLSDPDKTEWLNIGSDPRQNLLFTAMGLSNKTMFNQLSDPKMYAVTPHVDTDFALNKKEIDTLRNYIMPVDDTHGAMCLYTHQKIYDSEPLLNCKQGVKQDPATKAYQIVTNSSDYSAFTSDPDKNRIVQADLSWMSLADASKRTDELEYKLGFYDESKNSTYPTRTSSDKQIPFSVQYDSNSQGWYTFVNMQRFFVYDYGRYFTAEQYPAASAGYPQSDYLPLSANNIQYSFENFMYCQLVNYEYQLPETIISKTDFQNLELFYLYLVLLNETPEADMNSIKFDVADTKTKLEALMDDGNTVYVQNILTKVNQMPKELAASLPPSVLAKLLYLIINVDMSTYSEADQSSINTQRLQSSLLLLTWIPNQKAYLAMLQNYQAPTENSTQEAKDSLDAIWHDGNSPLYFSDAYGQQTENFKRLQTAYAFMNGVGMLLPKEATKFKVHEQTVFRPPTTQERNAVDIAKELETGQVVLIKGYPAIKINLPSLTTPVMTNTSGGYTTTGTATLDGDIVFINKESQMSDIELTPKYKKGFSAEATKKLGFWLASIKVDTFNVNSMKMPISFTCDIGVFNLSIEKYTIIPDGYTLKGSLSHSSTQIINISKDQNELKGSMTLGFDITAVRKNDNSGAKSESLSYSASLLAKGMMVFGYALLSKEMLTDDVAKGIVSANVADESNQNITHLSDNDDSTNNLNSNSNEAASLLPFSNINPLMFMP